MIGYLFSFFSKSPVLTLTDESTKVALPLAEKLEINHNTRKLRFRLPSDNHILGISPGQHVCLSAKIDGKLLVRSYTPISDCQQKGYVDIIVKVYFKGSHPVYPNGGKMSQYLDNMKIGETIDFRGPTGSILYKGLGEFVLKKLKCERSHKKLSMVAGGSGLTPMLQIISTVLRNPSDPTKIRFLFANTEEKDILCRKELDELESLSNGRFTIRYIVSRPSETWDGCRGRITEKELEKHLFRPAEDNFVLLCGPTGLINEVCKPALEKIGHSQDNIYTF